VFDPSRLREDLFVFPLIDRNDTPLTVEHHAPGRRGSLVNRGYELFTHLRLHPFRHFIFGGLMLKIAPRRS
jgi:hypothetical protein